MDEAQYTHIPIMVTEVLEILSPKNGNEVLDVTVGLGGHSGKFMEAVGESGSLLALDADVKNLESAERNLDSKKGKKEFLHLNFCELEALSSRKFDIIFGDLGLSSPHLDDPERGFSFRSDAPLDLRFDRSSGMTGANVLAQSSEQDLYLIFRTFGEIKQARKIAKAILSESIQTTGQLKVCIEKTCGHIAASIMPQVFQALRIAVNQELSALETLLSIAPNMLHKNGKLGIITFHSLEDRMVKQSFKKLCEDEINPITGAVSKPSPYALLTKKPISPSEEECKENPRARSAKFRAICYTG